MVRTYGNNTWDDTIDNLIATQLPRPENQGKIAFETFESGTPEAFTLSDVIGNTGMFKFLLILTRFTPNMFLI